MATIIEQFAKLARTASYHFADDSGKEWGLGNAAVRECLDIYDAHPELHEELRLAAKGELWSLDSELKDREARRAAVGGDA